MGETMSEQLGVLDAVLATGREERAAAPGKGGRPAVFEVPDDAVGALEPDDGEDDPDAPAPRPSRSKPRPPKNPKSSGKWSEAEPALPPPPKNPTGSGRLPVTLPAVATFPDGVPSWEADPAVVAVRERFAAVEQQWRDVCTEIDAKFTAAGLDAATVVGRLDAVAAKALAAGLPVPDVGDLQPLLQRERQLYAAMKIVADEFGPAHEAACRRVAATLADRLAPHVRAMAKAWIPLIEANHALAREVATLEAAGYFWYMPNLPLGVSGTIVLGRSACEAKLRELVAAGVLTADEIAGVLPQPEPPVVPPEPVKPLPGLSPRDSVHQFAAAGDHEPLIMSMEADAKLGRRGAVGALLPGQK